jgi:CRP-like cAMP-binding protein
MAGPSTLQDSQNLRGRGGKDLLRKVEFQAGQTLFTERDAAEALYVIDAGSVKISKRVHTLPCHIEVLSVGDVLGEAALFGPDATYRVRAIALEPTRCLRVLGQQFGDMVLRSPDIALRIMRKLSSRLMHSHFRLSNFALRSGMARFMHQLLAEHERAEDKSAVPLPYDLPDVLSTERGAVDEMIRTLIKERLVLVSDKGTFTLLDREAFDRYLTYLELHDRFGRLDPFEDTK